jgi:hypothetical protein
LGPRSNFCQLLVWISDAPRIFFHPGDPASLSTVCFGAVVCRLCTTAHSHSFLERIHPHSLFAGLVIQLLRDPAIWQAAPHISFVGCPNPSRPLRGRTPISKSTALAPLFLPRPLCRPRSGVNLAPACLGRAQGQRGKSKQRDISPLGSTLEDKSTAASVPGFLAPWGLDNTSLLLCGTPVLPYSFFSINHHHVAASQPASRVACFPPRVAAPSCIRRPPPFVIAPFDPDRERGRRKLKFRKRKRAEGD